MILLKTASGENHVCVTESRYVTLTSTKDKRDKRLNSPPKTEISGVATLARPCVVPIRAFKTRSTRDLVAFTTIEVTEEVKRKLVKLANEVKAEKGREVSISDVIEMLISFYEGRKGLRMADFDGLMTEMDEDSSEKVDEVVYGKTHR